MEGHGIEKFKDADLLATSLSRPWSMLSAEIRSHTAGEIAAFTPQNAEITQVMRDTKQAISTRRSGGVCQEVTSFVGTTWLCPAGIEEEATRLSDDFPEVLHIYIPHHSFTQLSEQGDIRCSAHDLLYECQVSDETVRRVTSGVIEELRQETSSGGLRIDSLTVDLIATLSRDHMETPQSRGPVALSKGILDKKRLRRVLDYIDDHLEQDITVPDLAGAACFSLFHFTRAFQTAMGRTPHAYVSERRLDRAKNLLAYSQHSLIDISATCSFSGQANFTKAFTRAVGISPGRYRRAYK